MRHKKAINAKYLYGTYIGVALALIVVLLLVFYWYTSKLTGFEPGEATYQIFGGARMSYSKDTRFYQDEGRTYIKDGEKNLESTNTPLLYNTGGKLTLVNDMLLMVPSESMDVKRVLTFSTVSMAGGRVNIDKNDARAQSYGGIMYDGVDTYIFLEDVKLEIGTEEYDLAPLSYAVVSYNDRVEFYNSADDSSEIIGLGNTNVFATLKSGPRFDLSTDVIFKDGQEALLYTSVDKVDAIEMGR